MATIKITKQSFETDTIETFIIQSNIFTSLSVKLNSPMFVQDLPEQDEEQTIVIKVTGNTQRISYTFKLIKLSSNLVTSGLSSGIDTSTVEGQMGFLLNEFRPTSIKDKYIFEILNPNLIVRECSLEELDINFDDDPINPLCNMTFVVGRVQSPNGSGTPRKAPTIISVTDVAGNPSVSWTNVTTADQGSAGAITGYKVERRGEIGSWEELSTTATTPYSDTTASDVTGTKYKYRVSAINPAGQGVHSKVLSHTRP